MTYLKERMWWSAKERQAAQSSEFRKTEHYWIWQRLPSCAQGTEGVCPATNRKMDQDCSVAPIACVCLLCTIVCKGLCDYTHTVPHTEETDSGWDQHVNSSRCWVLQQLYTKHTTEHRGDKLSPRTRKISWSDLWAVFQYISRHHLSHERDKGIPVRSCPHRSKSGIKVLVQRLKMV